MKKSYRRSLALAIIILFIIVIIWVRNEWYEFINDDKRMPGRDTVAFWYANTSGYMYEIIRSSSKFSLFIYDSASTDDQYYEVIDDVHFYADTTSYIFVVTIDKDCYCINKTNGQISSSMLFDMVPFTERKVCFINLLNENQSHVVIEYH